MFATNQIHLIIHQQAMIHSMKNTGVLVFLYIHGVADGQAHSRLPNNCESVLIV